MGAERNVIHRSSRYDLKRFEFGNISLSPNGSTIAIGSFRNFEDDYEFGQVHVYYFDGSSKSSQCSKETLLMVNKERNGLGIPFHFLLMTMYSQLDHLTLVLIKLQINLDEFEFIWQ